MTDQQGAIRAALPPLTVFWNALLSAADVFPIVILYSANAVGFYFLSRNISIQKPDGLLLLYGEIGLTSILELYLLHHLLRMPSLRSKAVEKFLVLSEQETYWRALVRRFFLFFILEIVGSSVLIFTVFAMPLFILPVNVMLFAFYLDPCMSRLRATMRSLISSAQPYVIPLWLIMAAIEFVVLTLRLRTEEVGLSIGILIIESYLNVANFTLILHMLKAGESAHRIIQHGGDY